MLSITKRTVHNGLINMKTLDLHGLYHHEVEDVVEDFVIKNYKSLPLSIIVGNSSIMRDLTEEVLIRNNFEYRIPAHNAGEIVVTFDKDYKI